MLACPGCSHRQRGGNAKLVERTEPIKKVEAVDAQSATMPATDAECPACKNKRAYFRTEQTRAADEPETIFFTCTKCEKTWRDYQ